MRADRSRAMVYESVDHGNEVTCHEVLLVLFLVFRNKKINKTLSETTRLRLVVPLEF